MHGRKIFNTGVHSEQTGSAAILSIVLLAVIGIGASLYQRKQYNLQASILRVNATREAERKIQSAATLTRMLMGTNLLTTADTELPPTIEFSGSSSPKFYALKPRSGSTPAVMHFRFCDPFKLSDTTFSQSFTEPSVLRPPLLSFNPELEQINETGGCAGKTIAVALRFTRMVDPTHVEIAAKATYTPTAAIGQVVVNETIQMPISVSGPPPALVCVTDLNKDGDHSDQICVDPSTFHPCPGGASPAGARVLGIGAGNIIYIGVFMGNPTLSTGGDTGCIPTTPARIDWYINTLWPSCGPIVLPSGQSVCTVSVGSAP